MCHNEFLKLFSKNLRYLRLKNGMTQKEAADLCGLTRSSYTYYESGTSTPPIYKLYLLAEYFEVKVDDLLIEDLELKDLIVMDEKVRDISNAEK